MSWLENITFSRRQKTFDGSGRRHPETEPTFFMTSSSLILTVGQREWAGKTNILTCTFLIVTCLSWEVNEITVCRDIMILLHGNITVSFIAVDTWSEYTGGITFCVSRINMSLGIMSKAMCYTPWIQIWFILCSMSSSLSFSQFLSAFIAWTQQQN